METILVGTPIPHKLGSENLTFPDGVSIEKIQNIQWDGSFLNQIMPGMDVNAISRWPVWLTVSKDVERDHNAPPDYEKAQRAMSALQIIRPFGCKNVYMNFRKNQEGWTHLKCGFHQAEIQACLLQGIQSIGHSMRKLFAYKILLLCWNLDFKRTIHT